MWKRKKVAKKAINMMLFYNGDLKREESDEKDLQQMFKANGFQAGVHVAESESDGQAFNNINMNQNYWMIFTAILNQIIGPILRSYGSKMSY